MPFVSAKYLLPDPTSPPDAPQQVHATDTDGSVWTMPEDSQVGDWLVYLEEGGTIDPADPFVVTSELVNVERDRRITGGFDYMEHRFQSDEFSQRNIMDAMQAADLAIAQGAGDTDYSWQLEAPATRAPPAGGGGTSTDYYWIVENNTRLRMTAYDVRGMAQMMIRMKQRMVRNARDLKDIDPIPLDYKDDKYWPFTPPPEIPI